MRSALVPLTVVLLSLLAPPILAAPAAEARPALNGRLEMRDGVQVLTLWGTPRERGFAHGWLLAGAVIRQSGEDLAQLLGENAPATLARVRPMISRVFAFSEDEEAEMAGILAGVRARLPAEKRTIPLLGREIDLQDVRLLNTVGDWYALGCSSAAFWGAATDDGTATVVRNFDFPALRVLVSPPHVRVVALSGETRGWVGVGGAGGIGTVTAMNDQGVFVAIHDVHVWPLTRTLTNRVPRLLALRRLMEQLPAKGACETARDLLRDWPTLYGNNVMIATPAGGEGAPAAVLEYDSHPRDRGVSMRGAEEDARPAVVCSNHHRLRARGACDRYDSLVAGCRLGRPEKGRTVAGLFALATRAAVPTGDRQVPPGGFGTLHQAVARTGQRTLWLRFLTPGSHIRKAKPLAFDVPALVGAAK